jgi:hypothetical protein
MNQLLAPINNPNHHTKMKRFIGLLLTGVGGVAALWGGYQVMSGQTSTHVAITNDFALSALSVGLIGVAVFTVGLVWMRD